MRAYGRMSTARTSGMAISIFVLYSIPFNSWADDFLSCRIKPFVGPGVIFSVKKLKP